MTNKKGQRMKLKYMRSKMTPMVFTQVCSAVEDFRLLSVFIKTEKEPNLSSEQQAAVILNYSY